MFDRLKQWGEIEVPLTAVVIIVALTVIVLSQPQKEVFYLNTIGLDPNSQK